MRHFSSHPIIGQPDLPPLQPPIKTPLLHHLDRLDRLDPPDVRVGLPIFLDLRAALPDLRLGHLGMGGQDFFGCFELDDSCVFVFESGFQSSNLLFCPYPLFFGLAGFLQ